MNKKIRWKISMGLAGAEKEGEFEVEPSISNDEIDGMAKEEAFNEIDWEWWEEKSKEDSNE